MVASCRQGLGFSLPQPRLLLQVGWGGVDKVGWSGVDKVGFGGVRWDG